MSAGPPQAIAAPSRTWSALGLCLAVSPAVLYLAVITRTACDVPRGDDFVSILPFLCDWLEAPGAWAKLQLLFAQYFSHRIVLTKCAALLDFWLVGRCDLLLLQAAGWAAWGGLAGWMAFSSSFVRQTPWRALPFFLLLMQPQGFSNLHTAMQAIQNIGVVLLAFAVFANVLSPQPTRPTLAIVLAVIAAFTSANGLLVFPAAILGLFIHGQRLRALHFLGAGILTWAAFFLGFKGTGARFEPIEFFSNASAMAGAFVHFGRVSLPVVLAAGVLLLAVSAVLLVTPATWRRWPVPAMFLLFLLLSIAMAAAGRIGWGASYMLQDRYRLYGLLVIAVFLLVAADALGDSARTRFLSVSLLGTGAFCLLSYAAWLPSLLTAARWCDATAMGWQLGNPVPSIGPEGWPASIATLRRAEKLNVYRLPVLLSPGEVETLLVPPAMESRPRFSFQAQPAGAVGGALLLPVGAGDSPARPDFAVAQINGRPVVLPLEIWRAPFAEMPRRRSIFGRQISFILPEPLYVSGRHSLHAYRRDTQGRLQMTWSADVDCPPLARALAN